MSAKRPNTEPLLHECDHGDDLDDPELREIRMRVREMQAETERLKGLADDDGSEENMRTGPLTADEKREMDKRSVYVGNVDYEGTAQDLESHFSSCGRMNRITILCDRFSGHPKGYAYIEFAEQRSVEAATALDESVFRGRTIKVLPKRTNVPGISTTDRGRYRGRSRGPRGGFRGQRTRGRASRGLGRPGQWSSPCLAQVLRGSSSSRDGIQDRRSIRSFRVQQ